MSTNSAFVSFAIPALAPGNLAAVPGIRLSCSGERLLVTPREASIASSFEPFPMPVLSGELLDGLARLLRVAYRRCGTGGAALLYLDSSEEWSASFPAGQPAFTQPAVANLVTGMKASCPPLLIDPRPGDGRLLAGGYISAPSADFESLLRQVPDADGIWVFHLAGTWGHAGAFARAEGRVFPLDLTDVAVDLDSSGEVHPNDRPWIICPA